VENFLRFCLQLRDISSHLLLTGRNLRCELGNTLA
jgi:hypothetical protein